MRPFQHFDAFNVLSVEISEVVATAGSGRVIDRHAVHQDERLVAGCAADTYTRRTPESAVLVDRDAGRGRNRVNGKIEAEFLNGLGADDRNTGADLGRCLVEARAGDDDRGECGFLDDGYLRHCWRRHTKDGHAQEGSLERHSLFLCTLAAREEGTFHNDMLAHCEMQPGGQAKFYDCRHKGPAFKPTRPLRTFPGSRTNDAMAGLLAHRSSLQAGLPRAKAPVASLAISSWLTVAGTAPDLNRLPS